MDWLGWNLNINFRVGESLLFSIIEFSRTNYCRIEIYTYNMVGEKWCLNLEI